MPAVEIYQYCFLAVKCVAITFILNRWWKPSGLTLILLNIVLICFFLPSYVIWNFLNLKTILVKPPLVSEVEPVDETQESKDDDRDGRKITVKPATTVTATSTTPDNIEYKPRKLEIEDQKTPLVFGEVLPRGCSEPTLIAETSRTLCLMYHKWDSVTLVKIIRMNEEAWVDGAANEIFISRALHELRKRNGRNRTTGFCRRRYALFVRDNIPKQILQARRREYHVYSDLKENFFSKNRIGELCDFLYLEYASGGEPLMNVRFREIKQAASVIVQVAFTIAVAEAALEFEHRHLEMDSIMVMTTLETHVEFRLNERSILVPTCGMVTRISNLGKARARIGGDTYYSNLALRLNDPAFADAACWFGYGFAMGHLYQNWSEYKPLTNVVYLAQLIGDVVFSLEFEQEYEGFEVSQLIDLRNALLSTKWKSMISVVQDCLEFKSLIPSG